MNENMTADKRISNTFNAARSIAILSVITAHTTFNLESSVLMTLINRFASIGVVVFILISGYYFNPSKYGTITKFMKSKLTTLVLPWWFLGSLVYLEARIVMRQGIGVVDYLKFMLGHGSYLYYLTVLLVCYAICFYPVKHKNIRPLCSTAVTLTVISVLLTASGVLDIAKIGLTDYLNVFNWIGYFCLGVLLKNVDFYSVVEKCRKYAFFNALLWFGIFALSYFTESKTGYFSFYAIPLQLIGAAVILCLCFEEWFCSNAVVKYVSGTSFCTYLVHMAIVPVVYKFLGNIYLLKLFMPAVTLALIAVIMYVLEKFAYKIKLGKIFDILTGVR